MRLSWDEYFLEIAFLVSKRSTCIRRQVGAVAVKDKHILATGYNGIPSGIEHCTEDTCIRTKLHIPSGTRHEMCRGLHGEMNVITQASIHGISLKDTTIYCTTQPCIICSKLIISAGIIKIVYVGDYPDELSLELLNESGIELIKKDMFHGS